jgi:hypothetical protein
MTTTAQTPLAVPRHGLAHYFNKRIVVRAMFSCVDRRRFPKVNALVHKVEINGNVICDHLYVQHAAAIDAMDFVMGEAIEFSGLVTQYKNKDGLVNYTLTCPTEVHSTDRPNLTCVGQHTMSEIVARLKRIEEQLGELLLAR